MASPHRPIPILADKHGSPPREYIYLCILYMYSLNVIVRTAVNCSLCNIYVLRVCYFVHTYIYLQKIYKIRLAGERIRDHILRHVERLSPAWWNMEIYKFIIVL
jgi:hypothetical protein